MLPGWPGEGGWTVWRSLAYGPYAVWLEVSRFSIGLAAFAVVVAYPWRAARMEEDPRRRVFRRLFLTLIAGGALFAVLGLAQEALGNGDILWISGEPATSGRASGPFITPTPFAAGRERVIPAGLAYLVAVVGRVRRRLTDAAEVGRGMGVRSKRAWAAALVRDQRRGPGALRSHTHPASDLRGVRQPPAHASDDRDQVSQPGGNHPLPPGGERGRGDERPRGAPACGRLPADPQDVAVAQRLLREAQHREQSAACDEREEQPPEHAPPRILLHAGRAPGIGNDDCEGREADRETGDLKPDGVGAIGERAPDRPATLARPAREHLRLESG